jgi:hypothetical protein
MPAGKTTHPVPVEPLVKLARASPVVKDLTKGRHREPAVYGVCEEIIVHTGERVAVIIGQQLQVSVEHPARITTPDPGGVRCTRLTNGFSKKVENHEASVSLWFMYDNFGRIHQTLRVTPAMEAGVADRAWSLRKSWPSWAKWRLWRLKWPTIRR